MNRKVIPKRRKAKKGQAAKTRINTSNYSVSLNPAKLALSQHVFHFKDTFKRLYKEPLSSLMTVLVIGIALALPACLYLMVSNAQSLTERWQTTHDISIYIDGSIAENKLEAIRTGVSKRDDVQLARIVTATEALQNLKQETKMDMISEAIGENPLPHTLIVSPTNELIKAANDEQLNTLLASLQQLPAVTDVQLDAQWVMKLRSFISLLKRSVWLLASLLALGVLLVVSNTIRLHVQQRQDEIEIKKLIGASDGFVRRPFLYLGFWYGLLGALLACLLVVIMLLALSGPAAQLSNLYASNFQLSGLGFMNSLWMIIMGTLLALSGAWLAAERTLHKIQVQ
jgi:cell division transport system permease protein